MSQDLQEDLDAISEILEENVGLSTYECDVYVTLVKNGKSTMSDISQSSGVPKHRVYDVAEKLRDRGFIEILDQYPKEGYAVPPAEVLDPVKNKIDGAKKSLEDAYKEVDDIGGGIAMMKSESTIEKYIQKIITTAEVDISLTLPYEVLNSYRDYLLMVDDDVFIKLIISDIPNRYIVEGEIELEGVEGIADEVYGIKSHEPFVISADRTQGLFWTGFENSFQDSDMQGFYVTNQEFALLFDRYILHSLLPRANELYKRSTPRDLPATYVRINDCISDLAKHDARDFNVHIKGYSTTTRKQVDFTGALVDYYSGQDMVAYLELVRQIHEEAAESIRVGGWKATALDDYEAHRITIS